MFIDYPELAWALFGKTAPADMTTPSGNVSDGNGGSSDDGGNNDGGNVGGGDVDDGNTDITVDSMVAIVSSDAEKILILLTLGLSEAELLDHFAK